MVKKITVITNRPKNNQKKRRQRSKRVIIQSIKPNSSITTRKALLARRPTTRLPVSLISNRRGAKMARSGLSKRIMDPYLMCRIAPLASMGKSNGIPDGNEVRRLVVDHRRSTSFTFGSTGTFNIAITPCVPSCIWWQPGPGDTTAKANGNTMTNNSTFNFFAPINITEWESIGINYWNTNWNYNTAVALYGSQRFRIVSVGWAITYVGAPISGTGFIQCTPVKLSMGQPDGLAGAFSWYSYSSGTNTNYNNGQLMVRYLEALPNFQAQNQFTKTFPLVKGCHGILHHEGHEFEYANMYPWHTPLALGNITQGGTAENISVVMNRVNNPATLLDSASFNGFDPKWDTAAIRISGGTAGQSFILDTLYCIEYCPGAGDETYPLAKSSPRDNPQLLARARQAADSTPVAQPGDVSAASTISTALSIGKTMVPIIASAF